MGTREIPRVQYFDNCIVCEKEILGNSMGALKNNMKIHMKNKHPEIKEGENEKE